MPFAYDQIKWCLAKLHVKEPFDLSITTMIDSLSKSNIGILNTNTQRQLKIIATRIKYPVYKYLESHFQTEKDFQEKKEDEFLREKGLRQTILIAKFCR